ncbi:MAG: hypothetical protein ABIF18_03720 [archaeon]
MAQRKTPDVDIKIRNINKIKANYHHGGHFWIFGSALAMILSYERSASILYAILHGILSWFYILFRAMQIWGWI